ARAYFMVDTEVPSATVEFLSSMMPTKPKAELYTMLGLQKQGKTLFYRDLHQHLQLSNDRFVLAPGTKGLVMVVFTLPSFPYVFKVIRDRIAPPKDTDRDEVMKKYLMVKYHDRVGRLADTLEYSHVAFPLERFDPSVVEELAAVAPSTFEIDGEQLVIKHMYIERRMVPLDIYLRGADDAHKREAIAELGNAIRELASANIFPGDLLLKNFGVTRHGRVVFYDYDEIGYLTDYVFRRLPQARSYEDEMAAEAWFSVGPRDIFPEELPKFLFADARSRELFEELHGELLDPRFWIERQQKCRAGEQEDVFPYAQASRFGPHHG
ncbi:MAG: bifunctional isocitrate dehydrogenase kinase/phosphatase, partial [Sandaracinaceae bacterium]|nr:bifunctional isocitrate dehydrogenase kinase/phosphatase [Sandaracinaceae bacterium]